VAKTKEVRALNFYGSAPKRATVDVYRAKDYSHGFLSAPLPSCLKGYETLHKAYGRLAWAKVLQPAIELAENGFVMTRPLSDDIQKTRDELERFSSTARVLLAGGRVPQPGEIFRQPDLARTLKDIAQHGADVFYRGPMAARIAAFYQANGGVLGADDLAAYQARWVTPISTTYRGYTVYTQPPSSSAIAVLEQLNILEGYDLKAMGHNSPEYLHLIGEVIRLAVADRNRYVGDPDFVRKWSPAANLRWNSSGEKSVTLTSRLKRDSSFRKAGSRSICLSEPTIIRSTSLPDFSSLRATEP
jgi:gamma-glutamyltranspeptidase/glutathione hydrolase